MKKSRTRTLQSTKYLKKKQKRLILNSSLVGIGIIVVIVLFIFISGLPGLQISSVNISGIKTLDAREIRTKTFAALEGKYFVVIPKTSGFFYSKSKVEQSLKDSFKKIKNITIEREGLTKLNIEIEESLPAAIVCEGFREEENQDKCFFVDEKAYIFEKASQISDGVYIKYYTNHTQNPTVLGNSFIDAQRFAELQKFVTDIKNSGVSIAGVLISDAGSYELYVKNKDQSVTVIYFDDRTPFEKTASNFLAFWQSALDNKLGASTTLIFDYINLRFGNNIFYTTRQ